MSEDLALGKGIQARLLLDSVNPVGCRLRTFVLKYPRFIHAEVMTHRQWSRSSSSSRAIPIEKMIDRVMDDPAMPVYWGRNRKGMQALEELGMLSRTDAEKVWLDLRDEAVMGVRALSRIGLHKQIANRPLEPWMHIVVIASTTTTSNFYALRDHPDAQPEIRALARAMREVEEASGPALLKPGEWHLPFISAEERAEHPIETLRKISVARCARVSYLTHEGERCVAKDVELHDRLLEQRPLHASPGEHVAQALGSRERIGNFIGWRQYRKSGRLLELEAAPQEFFEKVEGKWRMR
ncbi:MAG TPA: FAD-dependent thymidylate synthase [Thermoplasmata archaeon]